MKKSVQFADPTKIEKIVSIAKYSREESSALWYSEMEMEDILQYSRLVSQGKIENETSRGLELLVYNGIGRGGRGGGGYHDRHMEIVRKILQEQELQRRNNKDGYVDAEILGRVARDASAHRQRLAELRGKQDEAHAMLLASSPDASESSSSDEMSVSTYWSPTSSLLLRKQQDDPASAIGGSGDASNQLLYHRHSHLVSSPDKRAERRERRAERNRTRSSVARPMAPGLA